MLLKMIGKSDLFRTDNISKIKSIEIVPWGPPLLRGDQKEHGHSDVTVPCVFLKFFSVPNSFR